MKRLLIRFLPRMSWLRLADSYDAWSGFRDDIGGLLRRSALDVAIVSANTIGMSKMFVLGRSDVGKI